MPYTLLPTLLSSMFNRPWLTWTQISTLKSRKEDPTFNNFKLNWIPAFFILDTEGKVVAKAITADGLQAEINKLKMTINE